jgi:DNA polymerase elongation subunit (family B)
MNNFVKERKNELLLLIEQKKKEMNEYKAQEQAIKIDINSQYGALANQYFAAFDMRLANSVTAEGRSLIQFTSKVVTKYFKEKWLKDAELHDLLDIQVNSAADLSKSVISIYNDTDSGFYTFQPIFDTILNVGKKSNKEKTQLILDIIKLRITGVIKTSLDLYAKSKNTDNYQDFELENISINSIWLAKKKYVYKLAWADPGIFYDEFDIKNLTVKGVEIIQSSTPSFCRKYLKELTEYVVSEKFLIDEFHKKMSEIEKIYKRQNIEDISFSRKINSYYKYVVEDKKRLVYSKGIPIHVRGAACYNYLLYNADNNIRSFYQPIGEGDKVKWYYIKEEIKNNGQVKGEDNAVFSYHGNNYPDKLNPPAFDYRRMFFDTFVNPMNQFIEAMGNKPITNSKIKVISLL